MSAVYEVPTTASQAETFLIDLGGTSYRFRLTWNTVLALWVLDISKPTGEALVNGVVLVTGINVLSQYQHLGFPGALVTLTDNDEQAPPTFANLGVNGHLYFVVLS